MPSQQKCVALVLASGTGNRFKSEVPKQFLKLAGRTVLEHTLDAFERHEGIDEIVVVVSAENRNLVEEIVNRAGIKKITNIVIGGETRQISSWAGISAVVGDQHKVLVHDAVRPLIDDATIDRCLSALDRCNAVDTAIPSGDTIIEVDSSGRIRDIPDRSKLRLGQTPQGFRAGVLREAHRRAIEDASPAVTDDCGLVLHYGLGPIEVVDGNLSNIKITYPSDIYLADRLFQLRTRQAVESVIGEELAGKVVVVFGGSRGIGQSVRMIAESHGALVCSTSRRDGVDAANPESVRTTLRRAIDSYGRLDFVVNTAGVLRTGLLAGQSYDTIDEQLQTNLRGSIVVAKEAFELMRSSGGSIALFTSSSYTRGRARSTVYSATKAAVVNLVQGLAQEYQPFGVRINAINPERTATPMRTENFGIESIEQLLRPEAVAGATLAVCISAATGEVVDVRR